MASELLGRGFDCGRALLHNNLTQVVYTLGLHSMCGMLQQKVYRTRITDLDPLTMPLTNSCYNKDVVRLDSNLLTLEVTVKIR